VGGVAPPLGETEGGQGLPVALAPEEGAPPLPAVEFDGFELDEFELDEFDPDGFEEDGDEPDEFGVEPVDVPLPAPGKVPHGDPFGEVPGVTVDGWPFGFDVEFDGEVVFGVPFGEVEPGV
jgi:hypothetical protein